MCADTTLMPCLTPSDRSHSSPFQHCAFTSTSVLSVFVKRDRSACAVEIGAKDSAGSRDEAKAGKPKPSGIVRGEESAEAEESE